MRVFPERRFRSRAGFKLAELMVALSIFVLGGGVAYPLLVGDVALYARNFSINKSNNSLRYSLQRLKQDINMAIEPPILVNYSVSGTAGVLTPQSDSTVSAQGILLWVNLGPVYDMQGSGSNNAGPVPVTSTITLYRHLATTPDPSSSAITPNSAMPQIGDRLIIGNPLPYATGMPENVTMNGVAISKPGRRITSVNGNTTNPIPDNGSSTVTVTLDLSNTALPTPITGLQSVYVVREMAYVVYTIKDAANNAIESRLVRYDSIRSDGTVDTTNGLVLVRDLDPAPPETDATTNAAIQPFNYYGTGRGKLSALSINLPVRAIDYANAITTRQVTSSSEFNVSLLSSPQMSLKARLD